MLKHRRKAQRLAQHTRIRSQNGDQVTQDDPKMAPRRLQDGANMAEKGAQKGHRWTPRRPTGPKKVLDCSKVAQQGHKMGQEDPKVIPRSPQVGPGWPQDGPRGPQDGTTWAQEGPKRAQDEAKMVQHGASDSKLKPKGRNIKTLKETQEKL